MTTFVHVHGAWGGAWLWSRVRPILESDYHRTHAPTLTGCAERQHLLCPKIGLTTHIEDIANYLVWEELADVVLVGHSYAGMVITGAAARVPERVRHLVYLDAFVPKPGQSCVDILPWLKQVYGDLAAGHEGLYMAPPDPAAFGVTNPADVEWISRRLTLMPHRAVTDQLSDSFTIDGDTLPSTFINCAATNLFRETARVARADGKRVVDLDAGHFAPVTHASEVAELLLRVRGRGDDDGS